MLLKFIPFAAMSLLLIADLAFFGELTLLDLLKDFTVAESFLLMIPLAVMTDGKRAATLPDALLCEDAAAYGKPGAAHWSPFLVVAAACVLLYVIGLCLSGGGGEGIVEYRNFLLMLSFLVIYLSFVVSKMKMRLSDLSVLFRNEAPLLSVSSCSRLFYGIVFLSLVAGGMACSAIGGVAGKILGALALLGMVGFSAVSWLCLRRAKTLILTDKKRDKLMSMVNARTGPKRLSPELKDDRDSQIFKRIQDYMEKERPWLSEGFDLEKCAAMAYSNRGYISKIINNFSGNNFRQYVNWHRVQYSKELFRQNPRLLVGEVAAMAGFHSTVSFNTAFKYFEDMSPSDYLRHCRHRLLDARGEAAAQA